MSNPLPESSAVAPGYASFAWSEGPARAGWWWWSENGTPERAILLRIITLDSELMIVTLTDVVCPTRDYIPAKKWGWWAGPVEPPEPPSEEPRPNDQALAQPGRKETL